MPPEPLSYAPPPVESATARHNRIYTVLLIVLAFFCGLGMISIFSMSRSPTIPPESRWTLEMIVLYLRRIGGGDGGDIDPAWRLAAAGSDCNHGAEHHPADLFPFGTALGIYGLWKVDKGGPPAGA